MLFSLLSSHYILLNIYMDIEIIQEMFSEMGLGSYEDREKLVKRLSINMVESACKKNDNIVTSNNTSKP